MARELFGTDLDQDYHRRRQLDLASNHPLMTRSNSDRAQEPRA